MTTIIDEVVRCAVCGQQSEIKSVASSNEFGSVDLDTRPPEMMRSTISMAVHACPGCGYCAPDLESAPDVAVALIKSPAYEAARSRTGFPPKAREFLCHAMIAAGSGEIDTAAWATVQAAWICDDARAENAADYCRNEAVRLIDQGRSAGIDLIGSTGVAACIRTDLLRRAGRFEEAGQWAAEALAVETEEMAKKVLRFELMLIDRHDRHCHTVAEAMGPAR
jgi:hypothetical protein